MKGLKENALQGKHTGGLPPLGYDVDKDTRMLVINPREAEAVQMIFNLYLDGCTYSQIINVLNARGFKTKIGNEFANNSINSILNNPKYTGVFTFSRVASKDVDGKRNNHAYKDESEIIKVEGAVPALISKKDFDRVQECMRTRKRKPGKHRANRTYLLSGKVFCGQCGTPYVGNCRSSHQGTSICPTYRCNNRAKRPRCNGWEIHAQMLESIALGELSNIIFSEDIIPKLIAGYRQFFKEQNTGTLAVQKELNRQIDATQSDMDSIMAVIISTTSDALVGKLNALNEQKQELIQRLNKIQADCNIDIPSEEDLSKMFKQAREMLRAGQLPTVKALVERYVHKVIVSDNHIEIQFNLNIPSRVVTYPAEKSTDTLPEQKKISRPSGKEEFGTYYSPTTKMLAVYGGDGGS